ncbi:MAG TPA: hypothetical protein VHI72_01765, partial [Hyphomicrobiaceae bacterium]|nr:hypothetical protein [Hyphomicrobiaceae bacterium]
KTHEECNTGDFDNKWTLSLFARKVENGEAIFAYQYTPFDQWDYDGINYRQDRLGDPGSVSELERHHEH